MPIGWTDDLPRIDWDALAALYRVAPAVLPSQQGMGLGKEIVGRLVRLSAGHRKIHSLCGAW